MNRTIKERLSNMHQEGLSWPEALPIMLCNIRAPQNKDTRLSLYKVITGRPVSLHTADVHLTSDALLKYCSQLTDSRLKFIGAWASPGPGGHSSVLGQWVLVSKPQHLQTPLEPKFEGPYQIILVTDAAVKVKGKQWWIHATREIGRWTSWKEGDSKLVRRSTGDHSPIGLWIQSISRNWVTLSQDLMHVIHEVLDVMLIHYIT